MFRKIPLLVTLFISNFVVSQVFINELDADTPSSDNLEFLELKSTTPNFSLDGYVLVFYNGFTSGTGNLSYNAIDLDGYSTDINGIFLLGNSLVSPSPTLVIPNSTIQNGPDLVALYLGNASNYPLDTPATAANVIDALAYSNSATTGPTTLMTIFGLTSFVNENQTSSATTKSIQRNNNGTYSVATPTPGVNNDGSGVVLNGVSVASSVTELTEGESFVITFTTQNPVQNSNLIINFTLSNGNFGVNDFTGNLTTTILVGESSASSTITIFDDITDEGDEELKISIQNVPIAYTITNNDVIVRVHDNDYVVQPWGTPLNPTYGIVSSTAPTNYYSSLNGLSGSTLKQTLQDIIANPNVVHGHTYGDVAEILLTSDQNPANGSQVWQMYVEQPRSKIDYQVSSSNIGVWNREHIFPQSRGGFQDGTFSTPDGINVWFPVSAGDVLAGHGDAHHIRAEDGAENSLRGNRNYGVDYNGPVGTQGSWKGDVARALFYMDVRYNALSVVNGDVAETPTGFIGDLDTLLLWHQQDPPDDFEMNRNNYIYTWQVNRNPFIDNPDLASYIFGSNVGQPYTLSNENFEVSKVVVYPNPTTDYIIISGIESDAKVEVYSITGQIIKSKEFSNEVTLSMSDVTSGIYLVKISNDNLSITRKIVVK
jgi:hypothetical protein